MMSGGLVMGGGVGGGSVESLGWIKKRYLNLIIILGYQGHFRPEVPPGSRAEGLNMCGHPHNKITYNPNEFRPELYPVLLQ